MKRFRDSNYLITEDGDVINGKSNRVLKKGRGGKRGQYYTVRIPFNGKSRKFYVHRLVCEVYNKNPLNKEQVNHKDGNGLNNHFSNLEWVTRQENMTHAKENGLMCTNFRPASAKLNKKEVEQIKKMYENGMSTRKIADKVKVGKSSVHLIVSGQSYKYLKYKNE